MKWFCKHKDSKEIARFYSAHYSGLMFTKLWDVYRIYYLDVYKVFLCSRCGKEYKKKILSSNYDIRDVWLKKIIELVNLGYISYEKYIIK